MVHYLDVRAFHVGLPTNLVSHFKFSFPFITFFFILLQIFLDFKDKSLASMKGPLVNPPYHLKRNDNQ